MTLIETYLTAWLLVVFLRFFCIADESVKSGNLLLPIVEHEARGGLSVLASNVLVLGLNKAFCRLSWLIGMKAFLF